MTLIKDEEAERLIDGLVLKAPRERILKTHNAVNMLSSTDVIAPVDLPQSDLAAQDGYAIHIMEGTKNYTIRDNVKELEPGEATYIGTGWPLPKGANSVVRIELSKVNGNQLILENEPKPWGDVERTGEDVKKGTILLEKGKPITPYHVSLFLAMGITKLKAFDICAGIINIGDEIIPYTSLRKGIRDSITPLLKGIMPFARFKEAHAPDIRNKIASLTSPNFLKSDPTILEIM